MIWYVHKVSGIMYVCVCGGGGGMGVGSVWAQRKPTAFVLKTVLFCWKLFLKSRIVKSYAE